MPTQPTKKQWSDLKDDKEQQNIYKENVEFVSSLDKPTTNNLDGWEERFDRELNFGRKGYHSLEEGEDFYYRVIKFIKNLRKKDMEELIKLVPNKTRQAEKGNVYYLKEKMESGQTLSYSVSQDFVNGFNKCLEGIIKNIKDYYNK